MEEKFIVVINHEEQYSIWPAGRDTPAGWREAGVSGSKDDCLAHIRREWTDLRPLSVRR
jgi:MbtH protein